MLYRQRGPDSSQGARIRFERAFHSSCSDTKSCDEGTVGKRLAGYRIEGATPLDDCDFEVDNPAQIGLPRCVWSDKAVPTKVSYNRKKDGL